jgi:ribosome biogenesis protein UTP30
LTTWPSLSSCRSATLLLLLFVYSICWILVVICICCIVNKQIQLTKPVAQKVQKPVRVKIPHSLFSIDEDEHSVCLFCKTDDKEAIEKYLEEHPVPGLNKVVSMNDVKKLHKEFKQRKGLLSEHSHFLCHTSIARQLYNNLGNAFSDRNHFPVQVSFDAPSELAGVVAKAVASTYMHLAGTNLCIKMGKTSLSAAQNAENVLEGVEFAVQKLQNGWSDVHSVHLKTKDSASLPVYTKLNDEVLEYVKQKAGEKKQTAPATTAAAAVASAAAGSGKRVREEEPQVVGKKKKAVATSAPEVTTPVATQQQQQKQQKPKAKVSKK